METPAGKVRGVLRYEDEALLLAGYPKVTFGVEHDGADFCCLLIDTKDVDVGFFYLSGMGGRYAEYPAPACTYIDYTVAADGGFGEDGILAADGAHVDVGRLHLAVTPHHDATEADDEHLVVLLNKSLWIAYGRCELA